MIHFLFWNVCGVASAAERQNGKTRALIPGDRRYRNIQRVVRLMARRHNLDVIVLAESPFEGKLAVPEFLEAKTTVLTNRVTQTRLEVYHRNTVGFAGFQVIDRAVLHEIKVVASGIECLLATAHLFSPLHLSPPTRKHNVVELAADIRDKEASIGHTRTILVGDLNYDPHDDPITDAYGLNAVASKRIAQEMTRRVNRSTLPYFYNPMWAHLSDATGPLPGTYYRKTKDVDCRFWYLLDQVLIRPALLDSWNDADLQILSGTGKIRLLNSRMHPDRKRFSDHLPLVFALDL